MLHALGNSYAHPLKRLFLAHWFARIQSHFSHLRSEQLQSGTPGTFIGLYMYCDTPGTGLVHGKKYTLQEPVNLRWKAQVYRLLQSVFLACMWKAQLTVNRQQLQSQLAGWNDCLWPTKRPIRQRLCPQRPEQSPQYIQRQPPTNTIEPESLTCSLPQMSTRHDAHRGVSLECVHSVKKGPEKRKCFVDHFTHLQTC